MHFFPFDFYLITCLLSFVFTLVAVPIWKKGCNFLNIVDDPGHRKIHHVPTPLAGGPAIFSALFLVLLTGIIAAFVFPSLLGSNAISPSSPAFLHGIGSRAPQLIVMLLGSCGMVLLGVFDDKYEIPAIWKFLGQLLIAGFTAAAGLRITVFVPSLLFSYAITILWILTVTNALNFLDNMNGLCAGLGIIVAWGCAWIAAVQGQYLVALMAFAVTGSLLGFLPYNFPKATAFLGDAGSHLVGYWCAILTILPHYYSSQQFNISKWVVLFPLMLLVIPLGDLAFVIFLRWRTGQPIYIGDTNHISHRLVRRGFSHSHAVLLILLAASAVCFLAVYAMTH